MVGTIREKDNRASIGVKSKHLSFTFSASGGELAAPVTAFLFTAVEALFSM